MTEEETRHCTKCKRKWPLNAQNFGSYVTGAFKRQCRKCERERTRARYNSNSAAINAATVQYRSKNADQFNAYRRSWSRKNREMIEAYRLQQT